MGEREVTLWSCSTFQRLNLLNLLLLTTRSLRSLDGEDGEDGGKRPRPIVLPAHRSEEGHRVEAPGAFESLPGQRFAILSSIPQFMSIQPIMFDK